MNDYYVYVYYDTRQTPPTPFYVGKGRKDRYKHHLFETYATTENKKKYAVVQAIVATGKQPRIEFYATNLTEEQAYATEASLIVKLGRRDIDADGVLTNICTDQRPPNNKGRVGPKGKDHPNYGRKMDLSVEERARRKQQIVEQGRKQVGENNPFYGKKHSAETLSHLSAIKIGNKINVGRHQDTATRKKIQINNPNRRTIHTPYGVFVSAEDFCKVHPIISANGLRNLLRQPDKQIKIQNVMRNKLFTSDDLGKTPRELGWYNIENNE